MSAVTIEAETDAELIVASLTEPERFGPIFDRHATALFRYLARRVGVDDAETMLGEMFCIAFERRATYDPDRPDARPWLYGIATNLIAHRHRREGRRQRAIVRLQSERAVDDGPEEQFDPTAAGVAARVDAASGWPTIAAAIAELPAGERDALVLYVWEDLSYAEIADALDVPVGTVRSRLNRARSRLRELDAASGR
jgi:RNA polymerase sigma factor (sigma-70 family)